MVRIANRPYEFHRRRHTPEYTVWAGMVQRCEDVKCKSYPRYGGRGIKVCKQWRYSFVAFVRDVGPRPSPQHSLDRINNNGNYEPGNCRWATAQEQQRNSRWTRRLTFKGQTKCLVEWATVTGIEFRTLWKRLDLGWSVAKALSTPVRRHKPYVRRKRQS